MTFEFDESGTAFYLRIAECPPGTPVRTLTLSEGECMLDLDPSGRLLGIEILAPPWRERVPDILLSHHIDPPRNIKFRELAKAFAA